MEGTDRGLCEWFVSVPWLEWARSIFDLIKGVSWPLALFFVIWLFRKELRAQIPRLRSATVTGLEFQDQQNAVVEAKALVSEPDHILASVKAIEEDLLKQVDELQEHIRLPRAIRLLAVARLERAFERVFSQIFGTQIELLRRLQVKTMSFSEAELFYKNVVEQYAIFDEIELHQYLRYLVQNGLLIAEGDNLSITDVGRDFLTFVATSKADVFRAN